MGAFVSSKSVRLVSLALLAVASSFYPVRAQAIHLECEPELFAGCLLCTGELFTGYECEVLLCEEHNHYECELKSD